MSRGHRVVVTGMGIWSCLGQDLDTVSAHLQSGYSGIVQDARRLEAGLKCSLVGAIPAPDLKPYVSRAQRLTMSEDAQYAYMATRQALEDAGIDADYRSRHAVGLVMGNDGSMDGARDALEAMQTYHNPVMAGPGCFFRWVSSCAAMNLSALFGLRGVNLTIGAACASSIHAVGVAAMYIRSGMQKMVLAGGCASPSMAASVPAEALAVLNTETDPTRASRPFDCSRAGMVPSGGAAMIVLEEYEHAVQRDAKIYGEVLGYGCSANGLENLSAPDAEGEYQAMRLALEDAGVGVETLDYISAHATSTVSGDKAEVEALVRLLNGRAVPVGATKSMTGHENWMAGVSETVYCLLMMRDAFIAPTIHMEHKMPEAEPLVIPTQRMSKHLDVVMNNSFGLGGNNGCLVLGRVR